MIAQGFALAVARLRETGGSMTRWRLPTAVLMLVTSISGAVLFACGDDDSSSTPDADAGPDTAPTSTGTQPPPPPPPPDASDSGNPTDAADASDGNACANLALT